MATIDSDNECIQRCPVPTFPLRVNLTSLHGIGLIRNQGRITVSVRPRGTVGMVLSSWSSTLSIPGGSPTYWRGFELGGAGGGGAAVRTLL